MILINPDFAGLSQLQAARSIRMAIIGRNIALGDAANYTHAMLDRAIGLKPSRKVKSLHLTKAGSVLLVVNFDTPEGSSWRRGLQVREQQVIQDLALLWGVEVRS